MIELNSWGGMKIALLFFAAVVLISVFAVPQNCAAEPAEKSIEGQMITCFRKPVPDSITPLLRQLDTGKLDPQAENAKTL